MSRRDGDRLQDILDAIEAIRSRVARGGLGDTEPDHPWSDIARMRDRLAHRYFDTNHGHVTGAVEHDLEPLEAAVLRLQDRLPTSE